MSLLLNWICTVRKDHKVQGTQTRDREWIRLRYAMARQATNGHKVGPTVQPQISQPSRSRGTLAAAPIYAVQK